MHNTPEQNQAFREAFDATNARWKAAVAHEKKMGVIAAYLATMGITNYTTQPANGCTMVSYGRVVAYYYVVDDQVVDVIYD
jgi:2-methylcitrate dehydratase PrpD